MATDNKYYQQAQQQYDPGYNNKVTALKNQLAQQQQGLEQQKGGINANYDQQVGNANLNNNMNKNNVSNAMLGRGIGNSSIAVSGLAEQDAKNTRIIGNIEQGRLSDLNNIDQQKQLLAQNMENTLGQMAGNREDELWALARQLEDRDWDKNFKNQGLELQKQAQAYEKQYKDASLALQREQMKAEMGYKNNVLAMQREAQQAEMAYKNSLLAMQQEEAKNKVSQYDMAGLSSLDALMNNSELSLDQKYDGLQNFNNIYGGVSAMSNSSSSANKLLEQLNKTTNKYPNKITGDTSRRYNYESVSLRDAFNRIK